MKKYLSLVYVVILLLLGCASETHQEPLSYLVQSNTMTVNCPNNWVCTGESDRYTSYIDITIPESIAWGVVFEGYESIATTRDHLLSLVPLYFGEMKFRKGTKQVTSEKVTYLVPSLLRAHNTGILSAWYYGEVKCADGTYLFLQFMCPLDELDTLQDDILVFLRSYYDIEELPELPSEEELVPLSRGY